MKNLAGVVALLALLTVACGGGDKAADDASDAVGGGGVAGLCELGLEITVDDPTAGLSIVDGPEFFEATAEIWARVAAVAPSAISTEVATIRRNLDEFQSVLAEFDYDFLDPDLQLAMEDLRIAELALAGRDFDAFVREECGIDAYFDFGDISGGAAATD